MIKKIALVTGGFDPLHSGHIKYFESARKLADYLVVGFNSNEWLKNKKGKYLLSRKERVVILNALSLVDETIVFDDSNGTAVEAINDLKVKYPESKIIFCNGGDRDIKNIPEYRLFSQDKQVIFEFGVGGVEKLNSSSKILEKWSLK